MALFMKKQSYFHRYPLSSFNLDYPSWIGLSDGPEVLEFSQSFPIGKKPKEARLAIAGLGYFEAFLNGVPLDPYYDKPAYTDYTPRKDNPEPRPHEGKRHKTILMTYDVLPLLKRGENDLRIFVAPGYFENTDKLEPFYPSYGQKRLFYSMRTVYRNCIVDMVSEQNTLVRKTSLSSTLFYGERQDFSQEPAPFVLSKELPSLETTFVAPKAPFDGIVATLKPIETHVIPNGIEVDFGVNHTGGIHLAIQGKKGQEIKIRYSEIRSLKNGALDFDTSAVTDDSSGQRIEQTSRYILSGNIDDIRPHFGYRAYRYAEITGLDEAKILTLESQEIHAMVNPNGSFTCAEALFNEIKEKTDRTLLDNLHDGLLTDCPHREKRPYTGDGSWECETALTEYQLESFYDKWLDDILASQGEDGYIPHTAPDLGGGGGALWGNAVILVPDRLYRFTGDVSYLGRAYEAARNWAKYLSSLMQDDIFPTPKNPWILGDWATSEPTKIDVGFVTSFAYLYALEKLQEFATILRKTEDIPLLSQKREKMAQSFLSHFYHPETHTFASDTQGESVYGLSLELPLSSEERKQAVKHVVNHYRSLSYHFDTGVIATPLLLQLLFLEGEGETAYRLLTAKGYPSYHDLIQNETTLPETWKKCWTEFAPHGEVLLPEGGAVSHCHPMFGTVVSLFYRFVAGLDVFQEGPKRIRFSPCCITEIPSASASIHLRQGKASASYQKECDIYHFVWDVPRGKEGHVHFIAPFTKLKSLTRQYESKDGVFDFVLGPGHHKFTSR